MCFLASGYALLFQTFIWILCLYLNLKYYKKTFLSLCITARWFTCWANVTVSYLTPHRCWLLILVYCRKLPLLSDEEREILIGRLTDLKFIKSQSDTELHKASEFFDMENRLFQLMLEREEFPPEPFDNYRWVSSSLATFSALYLEYWPTTLLDAGLC